MSEEIRPMTPTDEEAELARVIANVTGDKCQRCDGKGYTGYSSWQGDCPVCAGRGAKQPVSADIARAILAAGYVKRNDALEEAAKVADGFQNEMAARFTPEMSEATKTDRLSQSEAARSIAARIRALKAKT